MSRGYLWGESLRLPLIFLIFLPGLTLASPIVTPQQALLLMGETARSLDYSGIFTYEHGGLLRTVRIHHAVIEGREHELLEFLNGPPRTMLRRGDASCIADEAGLRRVIIDEYADLEVIERHYRLFLRGIDRVAGRDVQMLYLEPRDGLRYGYVLGLDRETGLMLQSILVSDDGKVLERFQFSDIRIGGQVEHGVFKGHEGESVAILDADCQTRQKPVVDGRSWRVDWLPPGFDLSSVAVDSEAGRERLTFSDGLAAFSVFVDREHGADLPELVAQRGATVAFLAKKTVGDAEYVICVVGEVPPQVAQRVALSLSPPQ